MTLPLPDAQARLHAVSALLAAITVPERR
jgi:hypothetical protein